MAAGIVTSQLYESLSIMLSITQQFGKLSLVNVLRCIIGQILGLSLFGLFGISGYLWGVILTPMAMAFLMIYYISGFVFFRTGMYFPRGLIRYSFPYYVHGFVRFGIMQADGFIIGVFLLPEQLATYYVAKRFFSYLVVYADTLLTPIRTRMSELKATSLKAVENAFAKTSRFLSFSLVPVSFMMLAISYPLLWVYGSGKYINGVPILIILSVSAIIHGVYTNYEINVHVIGMPVEKLKLESANGILNIALGLAFVVPLDILGLAVGKLFSLSSATFYAKHLQRKLIDSKFDISALKHTLTASVAMAGIIVMGQLIFYNLFVIPLYMLIGLGIYMFLFCRNLKKQDVDLIASFLPKRFLPVINSLYFFGGAKLRRELAE